jgi:predicted Rossmann fold nucleotide-binding protein DprA/Smf involved in DNA uptake
MKTIGIIGSRRRNTKEDLDACRTVFKSIYEKGDRLVSGGCPKGGDFFCEIFAKEYDIPIRIHKAEWDKYGKAAGFKRNTYIAEDADVLICVCHADRTGGTEDTVKKAEKMGKTIIIVPPIEKDSNKEFDPLELPI